MGISTARMLAFSALVLRGACMVIAQDSAPAIRARDSWTYLGCYTDNVSGRALPNGEAVTGGSAAMTNELCQSACQAAGFSMAGTEYAGECCKRQLLFYLCHLFCVIDLIYSCTEVF